MARNRRFPPPYGIPPSGPVRDLLLALRKLRTLYERYFAAPHKELAWADCVEAHDRTVKLVRSDPLADVVADFSNRHLSSGGVTAHDLVELITPPIPPEILTLEKRIAATIGIGGKSFDDMLRRAREGLKRADATGTELDVIDNSDVLVRVLKNVHKKMKKTGDETRELGRAKDAPRDEARAFCNRGTYLVATVVGDTKNSETFAISYGLALGMSEMRSKRRKKGPPPSGRLLRD
jgi:hypothetical protein